MGRSRNICRLRLKCDFTRAETRFRLSAKRMSPFKSAGASVQSTTGSRGVRISGSNAGYTKFRGSVKGTGYPLDSPVSPSIPLPCVTVCHHVSTGLYLLGYPKSLIQFHSKDSLLWRNNVAGNSKTYITPPFFPLFATLRPGTVKVTCNNTDNVNV